MTRTSTLPIDGLERLLSLLVPGPRHPVSARRFACLRPLVEQAQTPEFASMSLPQRRRAAAKAAEELEAPARFHCLRALAIAHWEWALCEDSLSARLSEEGRGCYATAGALWRRLLPDEAFWREFAAEHAIAAEHQDDVRRRIMNHILTHFLERAKRHLSAGDAAASRFHAACLSNFQLPPPHWAEQRVEASPWAEEIARQAAEQLEGWISELLGRAKNRLGESLDELPAGICRNYEAALAIIGPALQAAPDCRRLLAFYLKQAADYIYDLAVGDRLAEARAWAAAALPHARRLATSHLQPGDSIHPDNRTVCQLFHLAGQLAEDPRESLEYAEERRRWGGASKDPDERRQEAYSYFQLGKVAFQADNFAEGERHLRRAIELDEQESVYREQLAYLYLCWARSLNSRVLSRFRNLAMSPNSFLAEARQGGRQLLGQVECWRVAAAEKIALAEGIAPPTMREEATSLAESLASPADLYWFALRELTLQSLTESRAERYADLLLAIDAAPLPADDYRREAARPLRAALYFKLHERAWEEGDWSGALRLVEQASECDPSNPVIQETLRDLRRWAESYRWDQSRFSRREGASE